MPLKRPSELGDAAWRAQEAEERLVRARDALDRALMVGAAKELAETIAEVVIGERGGVATTGTDFPDVVTSAHRILGTSLARASHPT